MRRGRGEHEVEDGEEMKGEGKEEGGAAGATTPVAATAAALLLNRSAPTLFSARTMRHTPHTDFGTQGLSPLPYFLPPPPLFCALHRSATLPAAPPGPRSARQRRRAGAPPTTRKFT